MMKTYHYSDPFISQSMNTPKCVISFMLLALLTGCLSGKVSFADFYGHKPTVKIEWPNMVVSVSGGGFPSSELYISPKVKIEGDNILIKAKSVLSERPEETTFNLNKLGMKKEQVPSAKAFWVDPDGTKHPLEIQFKKADAK
jgi:hypothetical protein